MTGRTKDPRHGTQNGAWRRLVPLFAAIVMIFGYGVAGYMLLGIGFVDALYMTSLALTTAGFTPVGELGTGAKLFTVTIALLGVSAFLAVLGVVASIVTERQFTGTTRRRRMDKRIGKLRNHFVVCAYGRVGRAVAREYEAEGVPFVVVDSKDELAEQMTSDGVIHIIGDPASEAVLRRAGADRARGLVCAVDSDATNVYVALVARSLNPDIHIVARAGEAGSAERLLRAGADRVISPYVTSGRHIALASLRPGVVDFFDIVGRGGPEARLDELTVTEGSPVVGRTLAEVCDPAIVLLLRRESGRILANPEAGERLEPADLIFLFGAPDTLRSIEEALG